MIDTIFAAVQTWPFWGQAIFVLAVAFGPAGALIFIVADIIDAIEVYQIRKRGRRWRKW